MATFIDLQNDVLTERFDATAYRDRVKRWLNDANRKLHRRLALPADQVRGSLVTTAGVASYPQPDACVRVLSVWLPGDVPARQGTLSDLEEFDPSDGGAPVVWVPTASSVVLGPTPDSAYTLELDYLSGAPVMDADSDTPSIPEEYHDLLVLTVTARGYFSEEDFNMASAYKQEYEDGLARLAVDLQHPGDDAPKQVPGCWGLSGYEG